MSRMTFETPLRTLLLGLLVSAPVACSQSQGQTIGGSASVATTAPAEPLTPEPEVPALADMPAEAREAHIAQLFARLLPESHLRQLPVDDNLSGEAFKAFLERLDRAKLYFLAGHVEQLGNYKARMDDQLKRGDLVLARKGAKLTLDRQAVVAKLVADILTKPFDFGKKESFETDPDKRNFVATEAELRDQWRKFLKYQVLDRVTRMAEIRKALLEAKAKGKAPSDDVNLGPGEKPESVAAIDKALAKYPEKFEDREKKAREDLASTYAGRFKRLASLTPLDPAERFLNAIAGVYDPHTRYLAPSDKEDFDIEMSGSLEGIGAVLSQSDHYIRVQEVVAGGPSWRQGDLEAGDLIMAVAQGTDAAVDVADMPIGKVVRLIRGKKGTVVSLTVKKPDDTVKVITITRDVVSVEASYAQGAVLKPPQGDAVGYVHLPGFYGPPVDEAKPGERNATGDVADILAALSKKKVDKVILDLRDNGGGYLEHARTLTGLFIPKGPVVQTRRSDGKKEVIRDEDGKVAFNGQVVVLVNRFSASASEIVAGALQDYERAVVVGTGHTFGKGTVQTLVNLDRFKTAPVNGSFGVLKLTIQEYFRVTGDSTQWRGVVPDITLPDPSAHIESGERSIDHSIPWSRTQGQTFDRWSHSWDVKALAASSATRVAADPLLKVVVARTSFLKKRRDRSLVPLERAAFEAQEAADKKKLESLDPKIDQTAQRFEVTLVGKSKAQGEINKRLAQRQKSLARDPWLDEALHVLTDMP